MKTDSRMQAWMPWALAYLTLGLFFYARTLPSAFAADDFIWLYEATRVQGIADFFHPGYFGFVRPSSNFFFWAVYQTGGLRPVAFHGAALMLHLLTALMLHALVRRVTGKTACGAAAAILFLCFRAHWESVVWSAAVGEVLLGFFATAALLAFLAGRDRPSVPWAFATAALYLGAVLSKEAAASLPVIFLLADVLLPGSPKRGIVTRQAPLWILSVLAACWERTLMQTRGGMLGYDSTSFINPDFYRAIPCFVVRVLVDVRARQAILDFAARRNLETAFLTVVAVLAALGVYAAWRRNRSVAFFGLFVVISCLPYAYFVTRAFLTDGAPGEPLYDRYTYLPSLGLAGAIGCLLAVLRTRRARVLAITAALGYGMWQACGLCATLHGAADVLRVQNEAQIPTRLKHLSATGCVYIYIPPSQEHYTRYAVALYGGLPLARVRNWFEAYHASIPQPDDIMLFYHVDTRRYEDVTRHIGASERPPPRLLVDSAQPHETRAWDFSQPDQKAEWVPVRVDADGRTGGCKAFLAGPELNCSPFDLQAVQIQLRAWSAAPQTVVLVGWSSDLEGGFGPERVVERAVSTDGQIQTVWFFPTSERAFWTEGRVHHLFVVPSAGPATVEIQRIRLLGW